MLIKFTVPGGITAKARHHTVALKKCRGCQKNTTANVCKSCGSTDLTFLTNVKLADQATEKYESFVALCAMNSGVAMKTYTGAVMLTATFRFPVPASRKKKLIEGQMHTQRPDLDNCQKSLLDGLNRVAWNDDSQVVSISCEKVWTHGEPGVSVTLSYCEEVTRDQAANGSAERSCTPGNRELFADTGVESKPSPFSEHKYMGKNYKIEDFREK